MSSCRFVCETVICQEIWRTPNLQHKEKPSLRTFAIRRSLDEDKHRKWKQKKSWRIRVSAKNRGGSLKREAQKLCRKEKNRTLVDRDRNLTKL